MNNKMIWYPWLNYAYKQLINFYQINHEHHALLIHCNISLGINTLIYAIIRWLMCQNKNNIKSCNQCHNCKLLIANTHPDLHKIITDDNIISIDNIRYLNKKLENTAKQGGLKIIWFNDIQKLTKEASNALLKTLEEPFSMTYFFLKCNDINQISKTLLSRCFIYRLVPPKINDTIHWLVKQNISKTLLEIKIAIKLNNGSPLKSLLLLQSTNWIKRKKFFLLLSKCLTNKTLLELLPELNQSNSINKIEWIISILLDAIKYKYKLYNYCINQDQLEIIKKIAIYNTNIILLQLIEEWQNCRYLLLKVIGLNYELQIINKLIRCQKLINIL